MTNSAIQNTVEILILSLRRNFRGNELLQQLRSLQFDFKIIWGLEVSEFSNGFLDSMLDQSKSKLILGRKMSYGELSCALGHLEMYENFILTGKPWGLFLEDDSEILPGIEDVLLKLPNELSPSIILLMSCLSADFRSSNPYPFPFLKHELKLTDSMKFIGCATHPVGAYAYLMNRSAALVAVHHLRGRKIFSPADFPFQFRNLVSFYVSKSEYALPGNSTSLLNEGRINIQNMSVSNNLRKNLNRRLRVLWDYSGFGLIYAKYLGLSGTDYFSEFIIFRARYKKFRKGDSSKFTRQF